MNLTSRNPSSIEIPELVRQAVSQITVSNLHPDSLTLRPPLEHQSNRLYNLHVDDPQYKHRHLIVKEFLKVEEWEEAPAREYRALQLLADKEIAPQPVFYDPTLGPIVIYEYLEGAMWNRRKPPPRQLHDLADLWLRVNSVTTPELWHCRQRTFAEAETYIRACFDTYAAWASTDFPPGIETAQLCQDLLDERIGAVTQLQTREPVLCFCRADPRFANVIQRPDNRLALVDWEDSGLCDPAKEIADLLTHPNQEDLLSWQEWQPFLRRYADYRRTLDPTLMERVHLYLKLYPFFWLGILLERGVTLARTKKLSTWSVNDMPLNRRLDRYLARAQTKNEEEWERAFSHSFHFPFFPESGQAA